MARTLAVKMLDKTFTSNGYSNIVVDRALSGSELSPQDKRLCSVLYYGVLERKVTLDYVVSRYSRKPIDRLDTTVLNVLRSGLYQILYLDGIPDSAAVDESVKLAKRLKFASASGFINAVLRNFIRDGKSYPLPEDPLDRLSIEYSAPRWLVKKLLDEYPRDVAMSVLETSVQRAPIAFRVNTTLATDEECLSLLGGLRYEAVGTVPHCYELLGGDVTSTEAFKRGMLHVQDVSSQACCMALDPPPDAVVLDICAAPGGKTFTLSEAMGGSGTVYAFDLHRKRVELVSKGAERLHLTNVVARVGDGSKYDETIPLADRVLCDVPCSGLGVVRRKPEIKYKDPKDFENLPNVQYRILENASRYLRVGGELVYSTCTLSRAENDGVVDRFLREHPEYEGVPFLESLGEPFGGYKATLCPKYFGGDGFFVSKVRRVR